MNLDNVIRVAPYKNVIDDYYNKCFDNYFQNINLTKTTRTLSPISAFFQSIVDVYTSMLYTSFPEFHSNNDEVFNFIEENKKNIDIILKKVVKDYVLYGVAGVVIDDDNHKEITNLDLSHFFVEKNGKYLGFYGYLQESDIATLKELNIKVEKGKEYNIIHEKGHRYLILDDGQMIDLGITNFDEQDIVKTEPFIKKVEIQFMELERLYIQYLRTLKALKMNVITYKSFEEEVKEHFSSDFNVIMVNTVNNYQNTNVKDLLSWVDNSHVATNLRIQREEIKNLKSDIVQTLNLQSIMNTINGLDTSQETRVSSMDKINKTTQVLKSKQNDIINFTNHIIKKYIALNLGVADSSNIQIEIGAVSLLEDAQRKKENKDAVEEILSYCNIIQKQNNIDLINLYRGVIKMIIKSSNNLDNDFLNMIDTFVDNYISFIIENANSMELENRIMAMQQAKEEKQLASEKALDNAAQIADIKESLAKSKKDEVEAFVKLQEQINKIKEKGEKNEDFQTKKTS